MKRKGGIRSSPLGREKYGIRAHEQMDHDEEGPHKGLPKRKNEQTGRPESLCKCSNIRHDPVDMEKTVSNVKAYFFNKKREEWDRQEKGAGYPENAEEQGKGTRKKDEWGNQGWGTQQWETQGAQTMRNPRNR